MCGRYRIRDPKLVKEAMQRVIDGEMTFIEFTDHYNVAPSQFLPILHRQAGAPKMELARWGLVPFWEKSAKPKIAPINARSEEAFGKPMFRQAIQRRRCLVPADGFYEWKRIDEATKIPHFISLRGEKPFFFAGIYEEPVEGLRPSTFSLFTTRPNELMERIHDRMPVILDDEAAREWVDEGMIDEGEFTTTCAPFPAEQMQAWPVSSFVNSPKNVGPECSEPLRGEDRLLSEQG